jgi:1-acyl-sn-glycerol-3-phosphate acyltransferase
MPDPKSLSRFEKTALAISKLANETRAGKRLQTLFLRSVSQTWVAPSIKNLLHVDGEEHLHALAPDRGILLCANHRSFFDQYVIMSVLVARTRLVKKMYFPVRSNFFYETWSGIAVNALIGGLAMYPPIFRDPAKAAETRATIDRVTDLLAEPGVIIGMHPEGTRGKGDDPYQLLPGQPGVGQVIMKARPIVLPIFINGLGNDLGRQILANYRGGGRTGTPIFLCFGPPLELGDLLAARARPAQYKRVVDRVMDAIQALGQREKTLRAELMARRG